MNIKTLNCNSTQKVTKTKRKQPKSSSKKVTDYFKAKKQEKKKVENDSEINQNDPELDDDEEYMEDSTAENYQNLFRGTVLARSITETDETSNDSSEFENNRNDLTEYEEKQCESRYRIVEIRKPEKKLPPEPLQKEVSQMTCLTLSDDENLTVDEGELVLECETTQTTEETVKSMTKTNKFQTPQLQQKKHGFDQIPQSEPIAKKFVPKNSHSIQKLRAQNVTLEVNSEKAQTSNAMKPFVRPLADYLPQRSPLPTIWTKEEEEIINNVFYGEKVNERNTAQTLSLSKVSAQTSNTSKNENPEYDSDVEMVNCVKEVERSLLQDNSMIVNDLPEKRQIDKNDTTIQKGPFMSAKEALKHDIRQLGKDPETCITVGDCDKTPDDLVRDKEFKETSKNDQEVTSGKISYLNSFLVGEYNTPIVKKWDENLSMQEICQIKNIGDFHKEWKKHFPDIPLAMDYLSYNDPTKAKLDVVK